MANPLEAKYLEILNGSDYMAAVRKPGRQIVGVQYYAYNVRVGSVAVPLADGVPQTTTFETQSDSDFVVSQVAAAVQAEDNGAMLYNGNVVIQIQDLSSGKLMFNRPAAIALVTGAGGFPFVLPAARVWNPNTSIAVQATNRDSLINGGAGPVGLFLAFHGTRLFYA